MNRLTELRPTAIPSSDGALQWALLHREVALQLDPSAMKPSHVKSLADLAALLMVPPWAETSPLRQIEDGLGRAAQLLMDSPYWEDAVVRNPGYGLEWVTLARFAARRGSARPEHLAPLRKLARHGILMRSEWVPSYQLSLAAGLEELEIPAGLPPAADLWSETMFGHAAPKWRWSETGTKAFLQLLPQLAGCGTFWSRLSPAEADYLASVASALTVELAFDRRIYDVAVGLVCCAALRVPANAGLAGAWAVLAQAQQSDGGLYEAGFQEAARQAMEPERAVVCRVHFGWQATTAALVALSRLEGRPQQP